MPDQTDTLTDKALSIATFAAYHSLTSGERVASVVRQDGHGHAADPDGVAELEARGLATGSDERVSFTPDGEALVTAVIAGIRSAGGR